MSLQFSNTTTKIGIIQSCEDRCSLGDTGISGNATLLKKFTGHINDANNNIWHTIFMSYGGWQYDDGNQTDLPSASDTLTADQVSYAMPSNAITIRGVEFKDESGIWTALRPLTEELIRSRSAMGDFYTTSGIPEYYQLVGDTVRVYPAANFNSQNLLAPRCGYNYHSELFHLLSLLSTY